MPAFRFEVTATFDIPACAGLLVVGRVLHGEARAGSRLRDVATGHPVGLLGIDLACGRSPGSGGFALIVDRADRACAESGRVWVADET